MTRITRRHFLKYGAGAGALLMLPRTGLQAYAAPSTGGRLMKYIQPLPLPGAGIVVATPSAPNRYDFTQTAISRQLHPDLPPTPFWAYDDGSGLAGQAGSFGMALAATSGTPDRRQLYASAACDLPKLASGRHASDAAWQPGAAVDPPAWRLCCGSQRRKSRGDAERVWPGRNPDRPLPEPATAEPGLAVLVP